MSNIDEHRDPKIEIPADFDQIVGLFARPQSGPQLPAFRSEWMNQKPSRAVLTPRATSKVALYSMAAVLPLVIGLGIFLSQRSTKPEGVGLRAVAMQIVGSANVIRNGQPAKIYAGDLLREGDRIETGEKSYLDLSLAGGGQARVKESTTIELAVLRKETDRNRIEILQQKGSSVHTFKKLAKGDMYQITTPTAIAGVRGTAFEVINTEESTTVITTEGSVEVSSKQVATQKPAFVNEGNSVEVDSVGVRSVASPEKNRLEALNAEVEELRKQEDADEIMNALATTNEVMSEKEFVSLHGRSPETIILRDGRTLRGIVASQVGSRVIVQTVSGNYVVQSSDILSIEFGEQ